MADPIGSLPLKGSARPPAPDAVLLGTVAANEVFAITVLVRRRLDAPPLPDQDHWIATPPARRKFLTQPEFAETYGASPSDLERVSAFLASAGIAVHEVNPVRRTLKASATADELSAAFGVMFGRYRTPTETYRGHEGPIKVPDSLFDLVEGVFGLDERRMIRAHGGPGSTQPKLFLTPLDVAKIYQFPDVVPQIKDQTIGLVEFNGGYNSSDIDGFFKGLALPTPIIVNVSVDGTPPGVRGSATNINNDDAEVMLDIDVAGSVASGAKLVVFYGGNPGSEKSWFDVLSEAIHPTDPKNLPSALSISWGFPEEQWSSMSVTAINVLFQEAAAKGMTIFVASGDQGTCGNVIDGHAHVDYPACDPMVTTCGGTQFLKPSLTEDTYNELMWNDKRGVTGGGICKSFHLPKWQEGVGVPTSVNDGTIGRGIPDIAGYADGYNIIIYGLPPGLWWGTSETAPLYAALIARINAALGHQVGYLNPTLYKLNTPGSGVFHDIHDGVTNSFPYPAGPKKGLPPASPGYKSIPGWDACTGLGSVNGTKLLQALKK